MDIEWDGVKAVAAIGSDGIPVGCYAKEDDGWVLCTLCNGYENCPAWRRSE